MKLFFYAICQLGTTLVTAPKDPPVLSDVHTGMHRWLYAAAPCAHTSTYIYVCVSEERDESRNESLLPDNSSLGSLSCCQPGEQRGWKSLQCSGNILYVSLTYQSMGQWAVASICTPLHTYALCLCVCVCTQIGGTQGSSMVLVKSKGRYGWNIKVKHYLVQHSGRCRREAATFTGAVTWRIEQIYVFYSFLSTLTL